jgi:F-type H+-transporting ATPase subunit epsilon
MTILVNIVSVELEIYSGLAEIVIAPAWEGDVGILPQHTPFLSPLRAGTVMLRMAGGAEECFYVSGGILEVQPHVVTILADTVLRANDIDEAAALKAKQRAEQLLVDKKNSFEYAHAQTELAEIVAQLKTLSCMRKRHGR